MALRERAAHTATFAMIAWRNMWRQKRRSLVVISSMAIGVFAIIISVAFINGMTVQMIENTINTTLGHVAIYREGYRKSMKLTHNFAPEARFFRVMEQNRDIQGFAPRVKIKGMISSSETSRGVMLMGIDPGRERSVSSIHSYLIPKSGGRYLSDSAGDGILISRALAEKLELELGDRLVVRIVDDKKDLTGAAFRVEGLFESPVEAFDLFVVVVGMRRLQELAGIRDRVTEIAVRARHRDEADEVKSYLKKAVKAEGIEILSWKDLEPNLVSYIKLQDKVILIFFLIMFITVIFSIANTLIMSIMERFHELGVMKCIGTRPSQIFFMVIFEAINLGAVGLAAGLALTIPLVVILGQTGIDFSFASDAMRKWKVGTVIFPILFMKDVILAGLVVLITTVAASIYPAVKAARIRPLEALHFV